MPAASIRSIRRTVCSVLAHRAVWLEATTRARWMAIMGVFGWLALLGAGRWSCRVLLRVAPLRASYQATLGSLVDTGRQPEMAIAINDIVGRAVARGAGLVSQGSSSIPSRSNAVEQ